MCLIQGVTRTDFRCTAPNSEHSLKVHLLCTDFRKFWKIQRVAMCSVLNHNVSFCAQKLKISIKFWAQKMNHFVSLWAQNVS
jgi:hypothetical protein